MKFLAKSVHIVKKFIKLQIEHLIMFNRQEFGLHHPGNVVPVCSNCNNRRVEEGIYKLGKTIENYMPGKR